MMKFLASKLHFSIVCVLILLTHHSFSQVSQDILAWEKDIRQFEKMDSTEKDPAHAILFTGSSSIRLWSTIHTDMQPYHIIQRGYGGAKLSDYEYYAKRIIYPHQFDAVVLFVANDITGSPNDKTPQEVAQMFTHILNIIRERYPETPVFWIEITPTPSRWKSWPAISEANKRVEEICRNNHNCWYIGTQEKFIGPDVQPQKNLFREDMLHLNESGYKIWTAIIKESLDVHLKNVSK